jgi:hypothetical protein
MEMTRLERSGGVGLVSLILALSLPMKHESVTRIAMAEAAGARGVY